MHPATYLIVGVYFVMTLKEPKLGDWEKLLNFAERLLGGQLSPYITWPLGLLILITLILTISAVAMLAIVKIKEFWQGHLRPKGYSPEQRQKAEGRKHFAQHLLLEIVAKNYSENWRDQQFTELEAEVEAEGQRWHFWPWRTRANGIRREKSLTLALRHSTERLILVEGDPGTGKSVALRHVAHELAARATKARSLSSKLPAYVNLKEIKREPYQAVDRDLIRKFILTSLNRVNDRFVDEFIEQEFDAGLKAGTWVFLFDSFDEIPDILSSTESDNIIEQYSGAISDFLSGINNCRGVVASRHYRGPEKAGWRTFRILELQSRRQLDLIKRSVIGKPTLAQVIQENLAVASDDVRVLARNPMLLGLLCEHVKLGHEFPATAHEVLSKYIDYRLTRDAPRVALRYQISSDELRSLAENCAFTMTANAKIGLSPTLVQLKEALANQGIAISDTLLEDGLSALVYMKLGRFANADAGISEQEFTFSHRRFQEHFATCVVLRDGQSLTTERLLIDARWRETAVTLLQTGDATAVQSLITLAKGLVVMTSDQQVQLANGNTSKAHSFPWTRAQLHVLRILEAGTLGGIERIPVAMRTEIGILLSTASASDNFLDKKLALEVAGTAPHEVMIELMRGALATGSVWLSDVVYQQASRLAVAIPEIYRSVRISVLRLSRSGALSKEYVGTKAYLSRMPSPADLLAALRIARCAPWIDFALLPAVMIVAAVSIAEMRTGVAVAACCLFWLSGLSIRRIETAIFGIYARLLACVTAYLASPFIARVPRSEGAPSEFSGIDALGDKVSQILAGEPVMIVNFNFPSGFDPSEIGLAAAILYAGVWYSSAEFHIKRGRYLSPLLWPLFPFLLIWNGVSVLFKRPELFTPLLTLVAGVAAFLIAIFFVLPKFPILFLALLILFGVGIFAATLQLTILLISVAKDLLYKRQWRRENGITIHVNDFIKLTKRVKTPWVINTALREIADQQVDGPLVHWVTAIEEAIEANAAMLIGSRKYKSVEDLGSGEVQTLKSRLLSLLFQSNFVEQRDRLYGLLERVTAPDRSM